MLYRIAPQSGDQSPAQIIFGRYIRYFLPAHRRSFAPEWQKSTDQKKKRERWSKQLRTEYYNRKVNPLPDLSVGNNIAIQHPVSKNRTKPVIVIEVGQNRDYLVKTSSGRIFRLNRKFLRHQVPVVTSPSQPTPPTFHAQQTSSIQQHNRPCKLRMSNGKKIPLTRYPAYT